MATEVERHVLGYECPACGVAKIGLAMRSRDGNYLGWSFRVPERQVADIRCEDCGRDVPRDVWPRSSRTC